MLAVEVESVGCDCGRSEGKFMSRTGKWSYPSYVGSYRQFNLEREFTDKDMVVEIDDRMYFVGNVAGEESFDGAKNYLKSKAIPDTRILVLTGIHRLVKDGAQVKAVMCHPIVNHHGDDKSKIKELLIGEHRVTVNDVTKRFYIQSVSVTPEGACAIFAIDNIPQIAHCIDIGSATVNYATWVRGRWIDRLSGTLWYGYDNSDLSIDLFARKVSMDFSKRLQTIPGTVYLIGGLAESIVSYMRQQITSQRVLVAEDPLFANARACYNIGVEMLGKEKNI